MGSRPDGSTGRRLGGSEAEGGRSSEPLTEVVEQQLARLPDTPLAEHPRVYETLDAAIRQELETEPA